MTDDERAIRELVETWMAATKSGHIEAVLDLMTDDVLFMTPGREPFGKAEFAAQARSLKGIEIDGRSEIQEIEIAGDWAWIRNHLDMSMTREGSKPQRRSGFTLTIVRKSEDGKWRLFRDANLLT
jgi:uncharacterized protein (TIGR02246 family)